ncbi:MAG: hypothetical protein KAR12_11620 [Methylococcales bacterium]|nr:hypothetical protein [Methylococcales bacterium]
MADIYDLQWFLSSNTSQTNTDPLASLGGQISTAAGARILSQVATRTTSLVTGVTVDDLSGSALGNGTLTYTSTGQTLQWTAPSGAIGTAVDVSSDGSYGIQSANDGSVLYVTVVAASLPGSNTTDAIAVTNQTEEIFDNVTKVESNDSLTDYRMIWLKNTGAVATTDDKKTIKVWINSNTPGQDNISIAIADEVASDGTGTPSTPPCPEMIANDITAPSDPALTFTAPTSETTALTIGDLTSTSGSTFARALWLKRTVPAGVDAKETNNTFSLSFSAKV